MKKKNTKFYIKNATKYCSLRQKVENYKYELKKYQSEINDENGAFESLEEEIKQNKHIKQWYKNYIQILTSLESFAKHNVIDNENEMNSIGKILKDVYKENLDELYNSYTELEKILRKY